MSRGDARAIERCGVYETRGDSISGTPHDSELSAVTRAIISLGCSLGLEVVAEGVEHEDQLEFAYREGCHYVQGNWFSQPRTAAELQRLFSGEDCFEGLWCPLPQTYSSSVQRCVAHEAKQ